MTLRMKKIISFFILLLALLAVANHAFAQSDALQGLDATIKGTGLDKAGSGQAGVAKIIAIVINVLLTSVGVILLLLLIYAGIMWMTAQGDDKKIKDARDTIKNAILGLIVVLAAYAITAFVMSRILSPIST